MKTGLEFIQRWQEDEEFRQQVNAFSQGKERLAFLQSKGYDFTPFIQILDNMSAGQRSPDGLKRPGPGCPLREGSSGFWGRLGQILRSFIFRPTQAGSLFNKVWPSRGRGAGLSAWGSGGGGNFAVPDGIRFRPWPPGP